jgi:YggT family protein
MAEIISSLVSIYGGVLLVRALADWSGPFRYNITYDALQKITEPAVGLFTRLFKRNSLGPGLLAMLLLFFLKWLVLSQGGMLTGTQIMGVAWFSLFVDMLKVFTNVLFWILIASVVMSWVGYPSHPAVELIARIGQKILMPIRNVVPSFGGIDFSPLILIIGLQLVGSILNDLLVKILL